MSSPHLVQSPRQPRRRTFPRPARRLGAVVGLLIAAVLATGCLPPPPPAPEPLQPTPIGVTPTLGARLAQFVDGSRPTPPLGGYPGASSRSLPTAIWYPSDGGGPFPLVVFAHGYGVGPLYYAPLLSRLAAAGYVVAAPTYPLLSGQPAGPTDTVGWDDLYADTRFVTSQVLQLSASGDPAIGGLVDPARIAVAGHSDGALLAFADGYTPYKLDPRVRAVISYAANVGGFDLYQANQRPFLHVLSDQDEFNPYPAAITWDRSTLQPPRTILSLWNASHAAPFVDPADAHFDLVAKVTIAFLDTHLKAQPIALFLNAIAVRNRPDLAMIE
jgi:dienelactone hydrolase